MSGKRYSEEFKIEAVKQVTERGYKVTDVCRRLGITSASLHKWIKLYGDAGSQHQQITAATRTVRGGTREFRRRFCVAGAWPRVSPSVAVPTRAGCRKITFTQLLPATFFSDDDFFCVVARHRQLGNPRGDIKDSVARRPLISPCCLLLPSL